MDLSKLTYRYCFKQIDELAIRRFLMAQKEDLLLEGETAVQKIIDLLFEQGGVLAIFDPAGEIVAMMGFFFGDPQKEFKDKETLYMYVGAIAKPYRMTRLFYQGMLFVMQKGHEMGMTLFRMQANIHDPYINKLYGRMGRPLGESKTLRGHPVMTYGGSILELLGRYGRVAQKTQATRIEHINHNQIFTLST